MRETGMEQLRPTYPGSDTTFAHRHTTTLAVLEGLFQSFATNVAAGVRWFAPGDSDLANYFNTAINSSLTPHHWYDVLSRGPWDAFRMGMATYMRFWWTAQWFGGYAAWAVFVGFQGEWIE